MPSSGKKNGRKPLTNPLPESGRWVLMLKKWTDGTGWQSQYAPLWEIFFNEPLGQTIYDLFYPMNLLYTMGYRPRIIFSDWEGETAIDREEAILIFTSFFENYMEITRDAEAVITEYIDAHTAQGKYVRPGGICVGTMIWPVDQLREKQ